MMIMILGLVLWFATHLFAIWAPDQRKAMTDSMGVASKAVMAVLTLIAVALMTLGYQDAPYVGVWTPPAFLTHVNNLLMILAVIFFIAGNVFSVIC